MHTINQTPHSTDLKSASPGYTDPDRKRALRVDASWAQQSVDALGEGEFPILLRALPDFPTVWDLLRSGYEPVKLGHPTARARSIAGLPWERLWAVLVDTSPEGAGDETALGHAELLSLIHETTKAAGRDQLWALVPADLGSQRSFLFCVREVD